MVLRPVRGLLCLFWRQSSGRARAADRGVDTPGGPVASPAGASHWKSLRNQSTRLIFSRKESRFYSCERQLRWRLAGCKGEGLSSPSSVTGFNGSANCGIRGLSSCFICSKLSVQANGLDQVTLLPFPRPLLIREIRGSMKDRIRGRPGAAAH